MHMYMHMQKSSPRTVIHRQRTTTTCIYYNVTIILHVHQYLNKHTIYCTCTCRCSIVHVCRCHLVAQQCSAVMWPRKQMLTVHINRETCTDFISRSAPCTTMYTLGSNIMHAMNVREGTGDGIHDMGVAHKCVGGAIVSEVWLVS